MNKSLKQLSKLASQGAFSMHLIVRRYMQLKLTSAFVVYLTLFFNLSSVYANECNVSKPNLADPIGSMRTSDSHGWFGSEKLATIIPKDGNWKGLGPQNNFRDKSWWWYKGYKATLGTASRLNISAKNMSSGQVVNFYGASDAYEGSDDYSWDAMSTALEFPEGGCWQIISNYENEELILFLWVGE